MFGLRRTAEAPRHPERASYTLQQLGMLVGSSSWRYGSAVGVGQALKNDAAFACIDTLASSISETPIDVVRYEGRTRRPVTPTPSLIAAPSGLVLTDVWLYQLGWSLATDGNAFGMVVAVDRLGKPTQIELIDPYVVKERKVVGGVPQAKVDNEVHRLYPFGDLWHLPGRMVPPGSPFATSPLEAASNAIGVSLAAEEFGAKFFSAGGHPTTLIKVAGDPGDEGARRVKEKFLAAAESREPVVMPDSVGVERLQVNPTDSQFIDTMRLTVEKVARFWRVPPNMIAAQVSGQSVTYANVTQADLNYLKHTLGLLFNRIEKGLTVLLPRPQVVKFNRDAILRATPKERAEVQKLRLEMKTATVNEVRGQEDEEPFPGDEFNQPGIPGAAPAAAGGATP